jgi:hypothetical protein
MPVHIRNFYYNKLLEVKKKENSKVDKQAKQSKVTVRK